jgi:uncharacterized protein (DUF362 family)
MENKINKVADKTKGILSKSMTRKTFLKTLSSGIAVLALSSKKFKQAFAQNTSGLNPRNKRTIATDFEISAVSGNDPAAITRQSIEILGGMSRFVKKGDIVSIKPNISWNLPPEYAANTNPLVVSETIKMCFESGAKQVKVFDNTLNDRKSSYENSGIAAAAQKVGATVFYADNWRFAPAKFKDSKAILQDMPFMKDAVDCDVLIDIPVAKHHGSAKLSLGLKNLIGLAGSGRGQMHWNLEESIYELNAFFKPDLFIIDANKIITAHGPRGGDLKDVIAKNTVVASIDGVLADSYSAKTFFNMSHTNVPYITYCAQKGLGKVFGANTKIKTITI